MVNHLFTKQIHAKVSVSYLAISDDFQAYLKQHADRRIDVDPWMKTHASQVIFPALKNELIGLGQRAVLTFNYQLEGNGEKISR